MKKFFAILLVALMLLPCIVACNDDNGDNGNEGSKVILYDDEDYSLPVGSINSRDEYVKYENDEALAKEWDGKDLNILATNWAGGTGAPWTQPELIVDVTKTADDLGHHRDINEATITRHNLIKAVYGVNLNFINSGGDKLASLLKTNLNNPAGVKYHIAMPRALEAHNLVGGDLLFDLGNSPSINLDKVYYNQSARESYTAGGHTYFVAGDFAFLAEHTSPVVFYNLALAEKKNVPDLYAKVEANTWTISEMLDVARYVGGDTDGEAGKTAKDTYGFATGTLSTFFQSSGITQVKVDQVTGKYTISLNDPRVTDLVGKIIDISDDEKCYVYSDLGEMSTGFFKRKNILLYHEVVEKFTYIEAQDDNFKVGVVPVPKQNADQETYYSPASYQSVLMCVPKTTPSKRMSTYFVDVLSWTGQEYLIGYDSTVDDDGNVVNTPNGRGYLAMIQSKLYTPKAEASLSILQNHVWANMIYDVGYMHDWNGLLNSVQSDSYSSGKNGFTTAYENAYDAAMEIVVGWNYSWAGIQQ